MSMYLHKKASVKFLSFFEELGLTSTALAWSEAKIDCEHGGLYLECRQQRFRIDIILARIANRESKSRA